MKKILFFSIVLAFYTYIFGIENLPEPHGFINDFANILDKETVTKLNNIVTELEQKTSAEIAIVTVKNLGNYTIENYAVKLFEKWQIGKKDKDNGILFITSIEDRKVRIEVGYGLEGILPDGLVGQILDKYVIPNYKEKNFKEGILQGTYAIASIIAKDANITLSNVPEIENLDESNLKYENIFYILLFFVIVLILIRHPILLFFFLSGRRGGFSGGGFGSSRFGGFGGGLSGGGGASRSW